MTTSTGVGTAAPPPPKVAPKPGKVKVVRASYGYTAQQPDELSFQEGDVMYVIDQVTDTNWWRARCGNQTGLIPSNYGCAGMDVHGPYMKFMGNGPSTPFFVPLLSRLPLPKICLNVENCTQEIDFPMHEAARRGNLSFLKECLQQGVSPTALDSAHNSPLHWACHAGHIDCVKELLPVSGRAINYQNKLGDTPLHSAASRGRVDVCLLLLSSELKADPRIKNAMGQTPLDLAVNPLVVNALKEALLIKKGSRLSSQISYDPGEYGGDDDSE